MYKVTLTLLGIILASCGIDRISKIFALSALGEQGVFFDTGFAGIPLELSFFIFVVISSVAIFLIWQKPSVLLSVGFGLILGGGVSNIYDRIVYGQVIDWIHFGNVFVYNLADAMIVIGIIICLYSFYDRSSTIHRANRA